MDKKQTNRCTDKHGQSHQDQTTFGMYNGIKADQDNTATSTTESIYDNISSIVQEETNNYTL